MVEIAKIVVKVDGQEIAMTIEEVNALRDALEDPDFALLIWRKSDDAIIIERI